MEIKRHCIFCRWCKSGRYVKRLICWNRESPRLHDFVRPFGRCDRCEPLENRHEKEEQDMSERTQHGGRCGTCAHCDWEDYERAWMCWNPDGNCYEQIVDVFDTCELYEERGAGE